MIAKVHSSLLRGAIGPLLALWCLACVGPQSETVHRQTDWVDSDHSDRFDFEMISNHRGLGRWPSDGTPSTLECTVSAGTSQELSVEGLRIRSTEGQVGIRCALDEWGADEISLIEAEISGLRAEAVELSWDSSETTPVQSGSIVLDQWQRRGSDDSRLRFDLSNDRLWTGAVDGFEISIRIRQGKIVTIRSIDVVTRTIDRDRLEGVLARGWTVEIDHDWRKALLTDSATAQSRILELAKSAELRFAYGLIGTAEGPVRLQVGIGAQDGDPAEVIFETTIQPTGWTDRPSWRPVRVDLSRFAGRQVTIELRSSFEQAELDSLPLVAWANPEIWSSSPGPTRPGVVIVLIDTLRADHLSIYDYERQTSPNIDSWAARGAVFTNTITQSPWTLPAHVSLFSGTEAFRHGVNFPSRAAIPTQLPMLAELLRTSGYNTRAITGGGFVHPRYGFARGFDSYAYWPSSKNRELELAEGIDSAIDWLQSLHESEPYFLFLHTFDVHAPYRPRDPYFEIYHGSTTESRVQTEIVPPTKLNGFLGRHRAVVLREGRRLENPTEVSPLAVDLYDSGVRETDAQLGRLFDFLDASGRYENTLVVLTSDHGEALGEQGVWAHGHLAQSNLAIPLIMTLPGTIDPGLRIDRLSRLIDIAPTILDLVGHGVPKGVDGRSLLPLLNGRKIDAPPIAWSYAPSTNEGLALRWGNEGGYLLRDSVWSPISGEEMFFDPDTGLASKDSSSAPIDARLRELAALAISEGLPGLRVELVNRSSQAMQGSLHGEIIEPVTVKSADRPRPPVVWKGMGNLDFEVGSGQSYTLLFLKQPLARVELSGEVTIPPCPTSLSFQIDVEIERLRARHGLEIDPELCKFGKLSEGSSNLGLNLQWRGNSAPVITEDAPGDADLLRRLEALGYVGN